MYVSLDVYIWLDVRESCGRASLQRMGDYVLASSLDRKEFDKFRDSSFYQKGPLVATDLLTEFMKIQNLPIMYIHERGKYYISNFLMTVFTTSANGLGSFFMGQTHQVTMIYYTVLQ